MQALEEGLAQLEVQDIRWYNEASKYIRELRQHIGRSVLLGGPPNEALQQKSDKVIPQAQVRCDELLEKLGQCFLNNGALEEQRRSPLAQAKTQQAALVTASAFISLCPRTRPGRCSLI